MILHFNETIDEKAVDLLVQAYNSLHPEEKLEILFCSMGGANHCTEVLAHLINANADRTVLIGYGGLMSNGFKLFFKVACEKFLLPQTFGMYHLTRLDGGTVEFEGSVKHNSDYSEFMKKRMRSFDYLNETHDLVNFSEKELETIKSNYDCYIDTKRLEQMLKYNLKYLGL